MYMDPNYLEREIRGQKEYLSQAEQELEGFKELADAFESFSLGFNKICRFIKSVQPSYENRISGHLDRIKELEKEAAEVAKNRAKQ